MQLGGHGLELQAYQEVRLSEPYLFGQAPQESSSLGVRGKPEEDSSVSNHSALKIEEGDSVSLVPQAPDRHKCESFLKDGNIILNLRFFLQTRL